ncbi:MAG: hypothetical protein WCA35_10655 [Kovacikia sp.]
MKAPYWFIPLALLASTCATPVFSLPSEPDASCYLINPYGESIDLTQMCIGTAIRTNNVPNTQRGPAQIDRSLHRGRVPQAAMQVYFSNGFWITNGKIQNQTSQSIRNVLVTLEIQDSSGAVQTQNVGVDQALLRPGELGSFQIAISYASVRQIEGKPLVVPAVRVASVQWVNQDGIAGYYP